MYLPRTKYPPSLISLPNSGKVRNHGKKDSFEKENRGGTSQEELRRKKLCFTCQQPWILGHKCAKGKAHYIEFLFEDDEEGEDKEVKIESQEEGYDTI